MLYYGHQNFYNTVEKNAFADGLGVLRQKRKTLVLSTWESFYFNNV